jgi:CheY-like chemotaxis protein
LESPPLNILLVEDNLAHQKIAEYAFRHSPVPVSLSVVRDGQEVLDFLYHQGTFAAGSGNPPPDLILLDLNLPKRDGREVLGLIRDDPALSSIPVAIVSTSDREEDIQYATRLGVIAYISKSSGFDQYTAEIVKVTQLARSRTV